MDDNKIEILPVLSKKENSRKMSGSKPNVGHKRRRSVTPMRPVAIAPKMNFPRCLQNVEINQSLAIKSEPGFIAIVPRTNQIGMENENSKSIGKLDQYEILEALTGPQNAKRTKIGTDDLPVQYIIVQNQSLDTRNALLISDNDDKVSNQSKTDLQEYTIRKNNLPNNGILQQCNVMDKLNLANCSTFTISPKTNFTHQDQISIVQTNEKINFNLYKNNSIESLSHCSSTTNSVDTTNDSKLVVCRNTMTNSLIGKLDSSNIASIESFDTLGSLKSKSQKPIVIRQQLLSPANRTNSIKSKRVLSSSSNKLVPVNIQNINMEINNVSEQASPPKSNESFYDSKTINPNATRINNYEQETDFLLKKEFPVISSSQVDSVLKAIDMQNINKGLVPNEVINHTKKQLGDKEVNDGRSLPCPQGAVKLSKTENTECPDIVNNISTRFQTNRSTNRLQIEGPIDNYSKAVEKLTDTLQCYKCKDCSYLSLNEKYIIEHIERKHMNISANKEKPVLKCPGCSNTFYHNVSLLSHVVHDHQVHESEARIMVQQLFLRQNLSVEIDNPNPISQMHISKAQNKKIFITQTPNPLFDNDNDERGHSFLAQPLPAIASVNTIEISSQPSENNIEIENSDLQCIQNINTIPTMIETAIEAVNVQNIPFLNEDKTFSTKSDNTQSQPLKLVEIKNVDSSENVTLLELKSSERSFEFVNLRSVSEGESYLQEDDSMERRISDSEIEFVTLPVTELTSENIGSEPKTMKQKKKGRPKGSKSYFSKPQPVSLKQGYKCEVEDCGIRMLVQENIVYHQKCHISTTSLQGISYQCPECLEFKTNNWNNLAGHLWRAHIIDMELHSCDLCSYKTPSLSNLTNQHRGIHGDDRPFLCDTCGKGFKTTKQLRNHRALHRAKTKEPLKCDKCKRNFTNTRLLKLHKDSVHKESKPFTCNVCSYSASTRSALKLHLRRHTGEKPFACEQCTYSTGDHNSLRRHRLRHLGLKPYSCPYCSYACIQSSTYKVHLKNKHPGLDHDLMFSCQYCSYKSIKKENLLTHMAKHEQVSNKFPAGSGSPILVE